MLVSDNLETDYFWIHVYVPLLFASIEDMHMYKTWTYIYVYIYI